MQDGQWFRWAGGLPPGWQAAHNSRSVGWATGPHGCPAPGVPFIETVFSTSPAGSALMDPMGPWWFGVWLALQPADTAASDRGENGEAETCPLPFRQGHLRVSADVGAGTTFDGDGVRVGAGVGVFVADGLEVGLDAGVRLLEDPLAVQLTPGVRYYFYQVPVVHPYAGLLYRRNFVSDRRDQNVVGTRVGAAWINDRWVWIGGGLSFEHLLDCENATPSGPCWVVLPEFFLSLRF